MKTCSIYKCDNTPPAEEITDRKAAVATPAEAKTSGLAKLLALGLTEAEANALVK